MSVRGELYKRLKMSHSPANRSLHQRPDSDFAPESWEDYFDKSFFIETSNGKFRTYSAGESNSTTIVMCIHGGGFSSLTWGVFSKKIIEKAHVKVYGIDLRGHGETVVPEEQNLSIENLVEDMTGCIEQLLTLHKSILGNPNIILVGHSLGGAIATWIAAPASRISSVIQALIVVDVVEGSAIASLSHMNNVLQSRPTGFETLKDAILWSASRSQAEDFTALRVSVPGQLKHLESKNPATMYVKEERKLWCSLQDSQSNMTGLTLNGDDDTSRKRRQCSAFQRVALPNPVNRVPLTFPSQLMKTEPNSAMTTSTNSFPKSNNAPAMGLPPFKSHVAKDQVVPEFNSAMAIENSLQAGGILPPPGMFRPIAPAPRKHRPGLPVIPQHGALLLASRGPLSHPGSMKDRFTWRVNLHASSSYWPDWFNGMSSRFLESSAKKLLILCGEDRLDTSLHRGHMQGKFQITILKSGHQVQEDKPEELSTTIANFLCRHQLCSSKGTFGHTQSPMSIFGGAGHINKSLNINKSM